MEDFATCVLVTVVVLLATLGVGVLVMDLRHYPEIVKQCKENGRIQNNSIRILCQVEEKK